MESTNIDYCISSLDEDNYVQEEDDNVEIIVVNLNDTEDGEENEDQLTSEDNIIMDSIDQFKPSIENHSELNMVSEVGFDPDNIKYEEVDLINCNPDIMSPNIILEIAGEDAFCMKNQFSDETQVKIETAIDHTWNDFGNTISESVENVSILKDDLLTLEENADESIMLTDQMQVDDNTTLCEELIAEDEEFEDCFFTKNKRRKAKDNFKIIRLVENGDEYLLDDQNVGLLKNVNTTVFNKIVENEVEGSENVPDKTDNFTVQVETCTIELMDQAFRTKLRGPREHKYEPSNVEPKDYQCPICGKYFTRKFSMNAHLSVHFKKSNYKCPICKKYFTQVCHLKEHMRAHGGVKPFTCSQCGKKFTRNSDQKRHFRRHNETQHFECQHCNKQFRSRHGFRYHMRSHEGVKSYECYICFSKFVQQIALNAHLKKHYSETLYGTSGETFITPDYHENHVVDEISSDGQYIQNDETEFTIEEPNITEESYIIEENSDNIILDNIPELEHIEIEEGTEVIIEQEQSIEMNEGEHILELIPDISTEHVDDETELYLKQNEEHVNQIIREYEEKEKEVLKSGNIEEFLTSSEVSIEDDVIQDITDIQEEIEI